MNIKETFINLTKRTYPHGTEKDLFHLLPENLLTDEFGNRYLQIGDKPSTMFTSHLDTASSQLKDVIHKIDGNIIKTDGSSILGADDKAGVTIMMYMIEKNVPGLYYFFLGEEVGCIGSRKVASKHKTTPIDYIKKVVSFDRRGTDSVITYQLGGRCCSDVFGESLAKELNSKNENFDYTTDPTGIYTDSAQFIDIYSECTNISVGYNYEHTSSEQQDILHLERLADAVVRIDWEKLPIVRNPKDIDDDDFDDYYYPYYNKRKSSTKSYSTSTEQSKNSWTTELFFKDPIYSNYGSSVTYNRYTKNLVSIKLHEDRLDYERDRIYDLLRMLEVEYEHFDWDGIKLKIQYQNSHDTESMRWEIADYIDELNFWKELTRTDEIIKDIS